MTVDDQLAAGAQKHSLTLSSQEEKRILRVWPILEVCILSALLVWFNLFPAKVGILISGTDLSSFVPLLAPEFQSHMPWLNLWWGMSLLLAVAKLVVGRWTLELRWADLGVGILGAYVLSRLVFGGPIAGLDPRWVRESNASLLRFHAQAVPFLNVSLKFGLGLALGGMVVSKLQKLVRLLSQTQSDWNAERASWYAIGLLLALVLSALAALILGSGVVLSLAFPGGLIAGAYLDRRQGSSQNR